MSRSITLHPRFGANPRLMECPRCGGDGDDIVLMGNRNYYRICPSCKTRNYGSSERDRCGNCRGQLYGSEKVTLKDNERILSPNLCRKCREEVDEHEQIVNEGGVYFKCEACGRNGSIRGTSEMAIAVRAALNIQPPKPCGVKFDAEHPCPMCGKKEE